MNGELNYTGNQNTVRLFQFNSPELEQLKKKDADTKPKTFQAIRDQ